MTWTNTFNFWMTMVLPYIAGMLLRASSELPSPDWLAGLIITTIMTGFCLAWWFSRSLLRAAWVTIVAFILGYHELLGIYLIFTPFVVLFAKKRTPPSVPRLPSTAPRDPPLRNWGR